jgi:hypothetical protein
MPLDLDSLDKADARLIQGGLKTFGYYDGTMRGVPGPKTKAAYQRYIFGSDDPPDDPVDLAPLNYPSSVRKELDFPGEIAEGAIGRTARQVQEWVTIHGFGTAIDEEFGPATAEALKNFQNARGLPASGKADQQTWEMLVAPMKRAFSALPPESDFSTTVLKVAQRHLDEHPIELGGANCGPWVRAYMSGNQGRSWPWCAGFVTFVMKQAAQVHQQSTPIQGSFSCDLLASQAKSQGVFVSERDLDNGTTVWSSAGMNTCCIFLVRRTSSDWVHTGFAFNYQPNGTFSTIEGNTNDEGSREGYEVCQRVRRRAKKDFILLN